MADDPIARIEAQLRADPDDWHAWRVYADHLLDRGDARGELIGLMDAIRGDPRPLSPILARRLELLRHIQVATPLPDDARPTWLNGFVVGLDFRLAVSRDFRELARVLADHRMPLLATLRLRSDTDLSAKFYAQLEEADLGRLITLRLDRLERGDAIAHAIARMPPLALEHLDMSGTHLSDRGLRALARAGSLPRLRALQLQSNTFGNAGLAALLASPFASTLEDLDLRFNSALDEQALDALATSPHLTKLRVLRLPHLSGLERIVASSTLSAEVVEYWRRVHEGRASIRRTT